MQFFWRILILMSIIFILFLILMISSQLDDPSGAPPNTNFTFTFPSAKLCLENRQKQRLIVLIFSAPHHFAQRNMVRSTWVKYLDQDDISGTHYFIVGATSDSSLQQEITQENAMHEDILQYNFHDSYLNLTFKTLAGLKFLHTFVWKCSYDYVLKTDDDMFVNIPKMLSFVMQHNLCPGSSPQRSFFCHSSRPSDIPYRMPFRKWYVSRKMFADDVYPPYCAGTGYMFAWHMIVPLLRAAEKVHFLYLEDVYVGLCAREIGNVSFVEFPKGTFRHTEQYYRQIANVYEKFKHATVAKPDKLKC